MNRGAATRQSSRRGGRRQQQHVVSRNQLLDAAEESSARRATTRPPLREVAGSRRGSVGSVYSFFKSKGDIPPHLPAPGRRVPRGHRHGHGQGRAAEAVLDLLRRLVAFEVDFYRGHPHFGPLPPHRQSFRSDAAPGRLEHHEHRRATGQRHVRGVRRHLRFARSSSAEARRISARATACGRSPLSSRAGHRLAVVVDPCGRAWRHDTHRGVAAARRPHRIRDRSSTPLRFSPQLRQEAPPGSGCGEGQQLAGVVPQLLPLSVRRWW